MGKRGNRVAWRLGLALALGGLSLGPGGGQASAEECPSQTFDDAYLIQVSESCEVSGASYEDNPLPLVVEVQTGDPSTLVTLSADVTTSWGSLVPVLAMSWSTGAAGSNPLALSSNASLGLRMVTPTDGVIQYTNAGYLADIVQVLDQQPAQAPGAGVVIELNSGSSVAVTATQPPTYYPDNDTPPAYLLAGRSLAGTGAGGDVTITLASGASLTSEFGPLGGIAAVSVGGQSAGGTTFSGGSVSVSSLGTILAGGSAQGLAGILAASVGSSESDGTLQGGGGSVSVTLGGPLQVGVQAYQVWEADQDDAYSVTADAIGIAAMSLAGVGATAGSVTVCIEDSGSITPSGMAVGSMSGSGQTCNSGQVTTEAIAAGSVGEGTLIGVLAQSIGGLAQADGSAPSISDLLPATGNGASGTVTVINSGRIQGTGDYGMGIVAQSIGGGGGVGGTESGSYAGSGDAADVSVTNSGTVTTSGDDAPAIVAQTIGGGGGAFLLPSDASAFTLGGSDGSAAGDVTIQHEGTIETSGTASIGIVAQSISGGGGSAAGGIGVGKVGGEGQSGNAGGEVDIRMSQVYEASISTKGDGAIGVLAQSVGGGGGNGGNAKGFASAVGGNGGAGGDGGTIVYTDRGSSIDTAGDYAPGLLLQSIGGGGGNGGYAKSRGLFASAAVGGTGGAGGSGGEVVVVSEAAIATAGVQSHGIAAHSVGGGGGNGGAGVAHSIGIIFTMSTALGGSGGEGGDGGAVAIVQAGALATQGDDAMAILAQSIGGGGGSGGASTAKALSLADDPELPTIGVSVSLGGSGGSGGAGGDVVVATAPRSDTRITTSGNGAHAILAQSIGGGGGNGGDSSAAATSGSIKDDDGANEEADTSFSLDFGFGAGGDAGSGLAGGTVAVVSLMDITTTGNHAAGIVAQSIGGGGGNGSSGDADSDNKTEADAFTLSLSLGGKGGSGGDGGETAVALGGSIVTGGGSGNSGAATGAGAIGVLAQSIGGGGGSAGGGTVGSDGGEGSSVSLSLGLGGSSGNGGSGGVVTVLPVETASIATHGGGAHGVVAQSIGGGGGLAGSPSAKTKSGSDDDDEDSSSFDFTLLVGGSDTSGGSQANGGDVTVGNAADNAPSLQISTAGDWAVGIVAQSIGGGGGIAGAAVLAGETGTLDNNVSLGRGASGGTADAGSVIVQGALSVHTTGYGALGILAQSVSGGGGYAVEGSDLTAVKTQQVMLGSGAYGWANSGAVTVDLGAGSIGTSGDTAHAVLAQSIAGGGGYFGTAGGGEDSALTAILGQTVSSQRNLAGDVTITAGPSSGAIATGGQYAFALAAQSIGGGGGLSSSINTSGVVRTDTATLGADGSSGDGGEVSIQVQRTIATTGYDNIAVVAQSIGGGGGILPSQDSSLNLTVERFGGHDASGNGGTVAVTLDGAHVTVGASDPTIGTDYSWGVLAQSIGGGGGLAGDTAINPSTIDGGAGSTVAYGNGSGNGGDVSVSLADGAVLTMGTTVIGGGHGIVAQSIGGSGGILYASNGVLFGHAGGSGQGGNVTVTVDATSSIGGNFQEYGWGIIAQSAGSEQGGQIAVEIDGSVTGSAIYYGTSYFGGGVMALGGGAAATSGTITIGAGGTLSNSLAILVQDASIAVVNNGTLQGAVVGAETGGQSLAEAQAAGTATTLLNGESGTWSTGTSGASRDLLVTNRGTLSVGGVGDHVETRFENVDYGFAAGARHVVDVDFGGGRSDRLVFDGGALHSLDGSPLLLTAAFERIVPGPALTVLTLNGTASEGLEVEVVDTPVFDFVLSSPATEGPGLLAASTQSFAIGIAGADFTPAGISLGRNNRSYANYLQGIWNAAGPGGGTTGDQELLAGTFARLGSLDGEAYASALESLNSESLALAAAFVPVVAQSFNDGLMDCSRFTSADSATLGEQPCLWAKVEGGVRRMTGGEIDGTSISSVTYQIGGQAEIAEDWFLGGSVAYEHATYDNGGGENGSSDSGFAGLSLKRQIGDLVLGAGLSGGRIWSDNDRGISLPAVGPIPAFDAVAQSSIDSNFISGRLQASYQVPFGDWYLRPAADLDIVRVAMGDFTESGAGLYDLSVESSSEVFVVGTPSVEIGGRVALGGGFLLHPSATLGVSFLSQDQWSSQARLAAASGGDGFEIVTPIPDVIGRAGLELHLYNAGGFDARLGYDAQFGDDYVAHFGMLRVGMSF